MKSNASHGTSDGPEPRNYTSLHPSLATCHHPERHGMSSSDEHLRRAGRVAGSTLLEPAQRSARSGLFWPNKLPRMVRCGFRSTELARATTDLLKRHPEFRHFLPVTVNGLFALTPNTPGSPARLIRMSNTRCKHQYALPSPGINNANRPRSQTQGTGVVRYSKRRTCGRTSRLFPR